MSKSKIIGMTVLVVFAMSILLVGNVVAGEYAKGRQVMHNTKWEQINVGDEKDHVVGIGEYKGIQTNMEGKPFMDGFLVYVVAYYDISPKTGVTANGYTTNTDKDGDKIYGKWDQKGLSGNWAYYKGTGKYVGIKGNGTWSWVPSADPTMGYSSWEGEVELPR